MKRLLRWKRLRWIAIGAAVRFVLRRSTARSVERAGADLEQRLPGPVRTALNAVPADAVRAGGSVIVAGRTAKRVAGGTRTASRVVGDRRRRMTEGMARMRSIGDEIAREAENKRRELTADYLRVSRGQEAADDALLDLRSADRNGIDPELVDVERDELPEVKEPIRRGRWRAERRLGAAAVNRVQRSYRRPTRPWDR